MKKLLITTLLSTFAVTTSAFAQSNDSVYVPPSPNLSVVHSVIENREDVKVQSGSLSRAKRRAEVLIDERIRALTSNKTAVTENKKLTAEQKATLNATLSTNVTNLTTLKAAIASSTDATSTKALIDSIFKDFRIYAIVIPQVRLDARIYQLKNHATTLSETFAKLQVKIDEQKAKGNDTTTWQKGLEDAKMLVAQDMYKLDELLKVTATLTPASYGTTSKAVIDSVNKEIKVVAKDFNTIVSKVRKPYRLPKLPVTTTSTQVTATTTP